MAKIAADLDRALARRASDGLPGCASSRLLASGDGWSVSDVVCTSGPQDRPFEERHSRFSIAIVAAGSFQYRAAPLRSSAQELMTPGSLMLGNAGQCFECGHEHGPGDRCLSFQYSPDLFETLAADAGFRGSSPAFGPLRLPPLRALSPVVARACAALARHSAQPSAPHSALPWEELSLDLARETVRASAGCSPRSHQPSPAALARLTSIVRRIEHQPDSSLTLAALARQAGLSRFHFLRSFERVTGLTPHQYVLRARLREASVRLLESRQRVLDIALDCGFGDVSNFNHAFRAEFGLSPRAHRLLSLTRR